MIADINEWDCGLLLQHPCGLPLLVGVAWMCCVWCYRHGVAHNHLYDGGDMKLSRLFKSTTRVQTYDLHSGLISEIGTDPFCVFMLIKSHAHKKTDRCYPSINRLVKLSGLSYNRVRACIGILCRKGLIDAEYTRYTDSSGSEYGKHHYEYTTYR